MQSTVQSFHAITGPAPTVNSFPQSVEVQQAGALDPPTSLFYFVAVRCNLTCYQHNRATIDQIVNSWTVKEP